MLVIPDIDERGWWFSREDKYFHAQDETNCSDGYEQSIEIIKNVLKEQVSLKLLYFSFIFVKKS